MEVKDEDFAMACALVDEYELGWSDVVPKTLTTEELTGYIAGLNAALDAMKGASTFKQAKEDVKSLLDAAQNLTD